MTAPEPGTGYFVGPTDNPGPGVLVLQSWWGLNRATKSICDRLADAGYTTLAPDLADGALPATTDEARRALADADMNAVASLVQSSARLLRTVTADPAKPIAVLGYSSGASWALWLSSRCADDVGAVVTFYGSQSIPLDASQSAYQCHFAENDDLVTDLEKAELGLTLTEAKLQFEFHHYPGTTQWFAEEGMDGYDGRAEAIAWRRTLEFLATELPTGSQG
ncbi:MAG: dienelactone hydrolase family protein [Actinomycetia bacterium]|nr:dienelactone hydrolase family protein [Actinomycetes bacterium]MCP3912066.1 dienelactone hydrolase family protein [Actinomycetes bacterium]